jgi:hypothetical protein
VFDILAIVMTVSASGTYKRKAVKRYILAEEVLIFLWHLSQWSLFMDQGRKNSDGTRGKLSDNWTWLFVVIVFFGYLFTLFCETVLVFLTIFTRNDDDHEVDEAPKPQLNAQDLKLDEESENNLERKITDLNEKKVEIFDNTSQLAYSMSLKNSLGSSMGQNNLFTQSIGLRAMNDENK